MKAETKHEFSTFLHLLPGLALKPVPTAFYKPFLKFGMDAVLKKYPNLFERMEDYSDKLILLNPTDLPFVLVLSPDPLMPEVNAYRNADDCVYDASITGTWAVFLQMLRGRRDGDALFFSRDLTIEGDTECVVALRNALDDAAPDVFGAITSALGPVKTLADKARKVTKKAAAKTVKIRKKHAA